MANQNSGPGDTPELASATCGGERCSVCGRPAEAKLGEEIAHDDPLPYRHNLTAYVCRRHFDMVLRPYANGNADLWQAAEDAVALLARGPVAGLTPEVSRVLSRLVRGIGITAPCGARADS